MTARASMQGLLRPPDKLQPPPAHAPRASYVDEVLSPEVVVGARVVVLDKHSGVVRFTGETEFAAGLWVGVELDLPEGKNDGTIKGKSYFSCEPAKGIFARPHAVRLEVTGEPITEETPAPVASATPGAPPAAPATAHAAPAPAAGEAHGPRQQQPRPSVLETIPSEVVPGVRVVVLDKYHGVVRFTGSTKFAAGQWVGAVLDKPHGKNNGTVEGVSYFHCEPLHGIFARPSAVKLESTAATSPGAAPSVLTAAAPVAAAATVAAEADGHAAAAAAAVAAAAPAAPAAPAAAPAATAAITAAAGAATPATAVAAPAAPPPAAAAAPAAPAAGEEAPAKAKAQAKTAPAAAARPPPGQAPEAAGPAEEPVEAHVKGAASETEHAVFVQQRKDSVDTGAQHAKVLGQLAGELQRLQAHIGSVTATLTNTTQRLSQLERQVPTAGGPPHDEAALGPGGERFLERLEERIQRTIKERLALPQQEFLNLERS